MSSKIWLGGIYLKEEGGYEIVLKALNHYSKRISSIGLTPELKDGAPMFIQILEQESMKTKPKIQALIGKIQDCLKYPAELKELENQVPIIEKALYCYEADIQKAQKINQDYYQDLLESSTKWENDLPLIKKALEKIKKYS